jgi:hypothetical protein
MMHASTRGILALAFATAVAGCAETGTLSSTEPRTAEAKFIGTRAPQSLSETTLIGADGSARDVAQNALDRGNVVVVVFFTTWCKPSGAALTHLGFLKRRHVLDSATIIAVNQGETRQDVEQWAAAHDIDIQIALDPESRVSKELQPPTVPFTLVLDPNGVVQAAHAGFHDDDEAIIKQEVASFSHSRIEHEFPSSPIVLPVVQSPPTATATATATSTADEGDEAPTVLTTDLPPPPFVRKSVVTLGAARDPL